MSLGLVSYESSSEESDGEDAVENKRESISLKSLVAHGTNVTLTSHEERGTDQNSELSGDGKGYQKSKLIFPPSSSNVGSSVSLEEDVEYSSSNSKLGLPAPKRRGNAIRIPAPALPEPDSDDDEEEPQPKKVKSGKKISSLFAMLPEPKHATVKQTNRLLIPHTLTKKKPEPAVFQRPPVSVPPSTFDSGSERISQDEEQGNFFSLDNSVTQSGPVPPSVRLPDSESRPSSVQRKDPNTESESNILYKQYRSTTSESGVRKGVRALSDGEKEKTIGSNYNYSESRGRKSKLPGKSNENQSRPPSKLVVASTEFQTVESKQTEAVSKRNSSSKLVTQITPPEFNEQPLNFSNQKTPHGYQMLSSGGASDQGLSSAQYGPSYGYSQQDAYHQQSASCYSYPTTSGGDDVTSHHGNLQVSSFMQDEAFQKMVGRGNFNPSAMNIIDVNADDHISAVKAEDWMLKSMTEEKEAREELKNEQLPTQQQKRKHQITYLARQARERELELKNSWAQNRMTRKQTQAKYGF